MSNKNNPFISLVTPMYNEEERITSSITKLINQMNRIGHPYEIILVNDGSTDASLQIAGELEKKYNQLKVLSYPQNYGRGKALRVGFAEAKGDIIITTESDSSSGEGTLFRLVEAIEENPEIDFVIASPNLPGGAYKNVPRYRVLLSSFGNIILRWIFLRKITTATGMTRCYRKKVIDSIMLESDGKEIHLEILSKALILGFNVSEIPAEIIWRKNKKGQKRKSSFKMLKVIISHLLFGINEKPSFFIGILGSLSLALGVITLFINIYSHIAYELSDKSEPFQGIVSPVLITLLLLFGIILLVFAFIATQNRKIHSEIIRLQAAILQNQKKVDYHKKESNEQKRRKNLS